MIKRRLTFVLLLALLPFVGWAQNNEALYKKGEVIVKFKSGHSMMKRSAKNNDISANLRRVGVTQADQLMPLTSSMKSRRAIRYGNGDVNRNLSALYLLRFNENHSVDETIEKLKKLNDIEFAEPNYIVKAIGKVQESTPLPQPIVNEINRSQSYNDPKYSEQWGLQAINMPALWDKPVINSKRPVIAILDTGVDINHPDLAANIWTNEAEKGNDEDGNSFVGDVHGWDFISGDADISDENNHGTHCAGIAAAVGNNGVGIVGANPDALIMPVRVLNEVGEGDVATIVEGIDYAIASGADVLSMSYGYMCPCGPSEAERDALLEASKYAILVAAAGNSGVCMNSAHQGLHGNPDAMPIPSFPAAFSFVIGVMASTEEGVLAPFSNFDCGVTPSVYLYPRSEILSYEVMAPGTDILSTLPDGQYGLMDGTSMACPLVAGAISSLIQRRNFKSNQELLTTLALANDGGDVDMAAAYGTTELPTHQINEVFTKNIEGVDITFVVKSVSTVQVGDGENAAIPQTGVTHVVIPDEVDGFKITSIARRAFSWSEVESVSLPNTLVYFENEAFYAAAQLKELSIPESVVELGNNVITHSQIKELFIPKNLTIMREGAIVSCKELTSIVVEEGNPVFDSRDNSNAIIKTATNTLILGTNTIPQGVEVLGRQCFFGLSIESITIPNSVRIIGEGAFEQCENLKKIEFPESIEEIQFAAFNMCYGLKSLYIPKSVKYLDPLSFSYCSNVTSVVVDPANSVYDSRGNCNAIIETASNTLIEGFNCTTIPDDVTGIAANAFYYCHSLKSVTIGKGVNFIGIGAFMGCDKLNSIVVVDDNPYLDSRDNCNAIIETATNTLIFGNHASTIPSSVKTIGYCAFWGTDFPENYHIIIPEGVEKICSSSFLGLDHAIFTLPSTIKEIENNSFYVYNEGQIAEVYCYRKTPLNISNYVFRAVETATLHVPKGQKAAYEKAKGWKRFGTIIEMDVEGADPPIEIEPMIESTETTFGGEEDIIDEETDLTNVVIENTYYTMDANNGDGYDIGQQALVLNSPTTEEQMNIIQEAEVGDEHLAEKFSGIIFEVPAGTGVITVDAQTIGTHMLNVQIGKKDPMKIAKSERETVSVSYSVKDPTYVYIYANTDDEVSSRVDRVPSAGDNSVLLFGYKLEIKKLPFVPGDANDDGLVNVTDIVATVNFIMEKPSDDFKKDAADLNGDGDINVTDIVMMVKIIMEAAAREMEE